MPCNDDHFAVFDPLKNLAERLCCTSRTVVVFYGRHFDAQLSPQSNYGVKKGDAPRFRVFSNPGASLDLDLSQHLKISMSGRIAQSKVSNVLAFRVNVRQRAR